MNIKRDTHEEYKKEPRGDLKQVYTGGGGRIGGDGT
jgi:hypothetical protein